MRAAWGGRGTAAAVVLAAVAALVVLRPTTASGSPRPPELRSLPPAATLDDGLTHVIVHVPDVAATATAAPAPVHDGGDRVLVRAGEPREVAGDELAALPEGAELTVDEDGTVRAVGAPAAGAAPASDRSAALPFGDVEGVEDVTWLGGDDYAVTTTLTAAEVGRLPGVERLQEDVWLQPFDAPNDPHFGTEWPLENDGRVVQGWSGRVDADIDATAAWPRSRGTGVVVAVVDTGTEITHPDLRDRMWTNSREVCGNGRDDDGNRFVDDCQGWDFANNDASVFDAWADNGHATHIAGTIAASTGNGIGIAGVAPAARIMPVKVGNSGSFRISDAVAAVNYAVDNGADLINASWGTSGVPRDALWSMEAAIERARAAGVIIVAAAGNDGANIDVTPSFPAAFPQDNVVTVGATTNGDAPASFSNHGTTNVDLFAPGQWVWSTVPGGAYAYKSGTSMAAPHVAGVLALLRAAYPAATAGELRQLLFASVDLIPELASRSATGGRVNAATAVGATDLPVAFAFEGLDGLTAGTPSQVGVSARLGDPGALAPGRRVTYRLSLATLHHGVPHAVVEHRVEVGHGGASQVTVTDVAGAALAPAGGFTADSAPGLTGDGDLTSVSTWLPEGDYALVAELVDAADGAAIGPAQAAFFSVGPAPTVPGDPGPGGTTPTTQPGDGSGGGTSPAPTSPLPTAPAPGGGTAPPPPGGGGTPAPSPTTTAPSSPAPPPSGGGGGGGGTSPAPTSPPAPAPPPPAPAPPPASPPTTAPAPVPAPPPAEPTPVFGITSLDPSSGPRGGGTSVVIRGRRLPAEAVVTIGGVRARTVVDWAPEMIVVETGAHAAGAVDVVVRAPDGRTETLAGAFAYLDPPPSGTPPGGGGGGGTAPAPTPTTAPAPGGGGSTPTTSAPAPPAPGDSGGPGGGGPTTTSPSGGGDTGGGGDAPVEVITAPNGLRLARLPSDHVLASTPASTWSALRCAGARCGGVVL